MKINILIIIIGLAFSTSAFANKWVHYVDDPLPYFYDKNSIKKIKNGLYQVLAVEHNTDYPTSRVYVYTFDCKRQQYKIGPSVFYSGHKGTGEIKSRDSWTSSMKGVSESDDSKKRLYIIVCHSPK